jgi:cellulose synthase/poly-beta-1,6-N-acetylglucosamine synthase-like glycosyltransferase
MLYLIVFMALIGEIIFHILLFLSVYVQIFFLVTFIDNRKKIVIRKENIKLENYPKVTITVPCWNEEKTVSNTVNSLLNLNYPQDKLNIFLVDDGSTDGTWDVLNKFKQHSNIKIFKKENGGKYTALNLGLENTETDFFGCLDADSVVHPEALVRTMSHFELYPLSMAVVPSVIVSGAKNVIQNAQRVEHHMGVYNKKMLDFLGAINVTPGPFTIFRKKVFDDLGPYKHAHNTEDMEIAYRMQTNDYKISHCNDSYVYTNMPATIPKLFRQRLRWVYGFINNTLDYKHVLFKKRYGNFALFTLPMGAISIIALGYIFGRMVYSFLVFLYSKIMAFQVVGFSGSHISLDPFFFNAGMSLFLIILVYSSVMFAVMFGRYMSDEKFKPSIGMIYFLLLFRIIAPFWILKAVYNTLMSRTPAWR